MLFEIASSIRTPLALGGFILIVLFAIYKIILRKRVFQKLTKIHSFNIINKIINYLFILSLVAIILGIAAYIIAQIIPTSRRYKGTIEEPAPSAKSIPSETLIIKITPPKFPSSVEKQKLSTTSAQKDFTVIHFIVVEEKPFPIIKVTLKNDTKKTQVITRLKAIIHEYAPYIASPVSERLKPLVVWNVELPYDNGIYSYKPNDPILIPSDNAASISLRLFQTDGYKTIPPHKYGHFILKFVFVTDSNIEADTKFFILWNNKVLTE